MNDRVFPENNENTQEKSIDKIFSIYAARPSRPILITENKRDEAVYKKAFEGHSYVSTVKEFCNADGRSNVISFISSIKEKDEAWISKAKIRGIIDRDLALSNNREEKHNDNNCFVTDYSEMEMYAFLNEDFSSFINQNLPMEYCLPYPETIELILRVASPLGAARVVAHNPAEFYINNEDGAIGFDYENFDFRVTNKKSFIADIEERCQDKLIIEVVKNINKSPQGTEIMAKVLDYFGGHEQYSEQMINLEEIISYKFENNFELERNSESAHLFLDLMSCPFLSKSFKLKTLRKFYSKYQPNNKTGPELESDLLFLEETYWFIKWDGLDLLKLLQRKELNSVY